MKITIILPFILILATLSCEKDEIVSTNFVVGEENNSEIISYNPWFFGNRSFRKRTVPYSY
jgi:hypothetical protein